MRPVADDPNRIWLSSYPKSGTTWVRYLLSGLRAGPPRTSAEVEAHVPCMHERGWTPQPPTGEASVLHTHLSYPSAISRFGPGAGFILVVRHPLDVLFSNVNYFIMTQMGHFRRRFGDAGGADTNQIVQHLASHYVHEYLAGGGDAHGLKIGYGSWVEHTSAWLAASAEQQALVMRYEDLRQDPHAQVQRMVMFLGYDRTPDQIDAVVEAASFTAMRRMEEREIAEQVEGRFYREAYREGHAIGLRFVNRGEVGLGAKALSAQAVEQVAKDTGAMMRRLGYAIEDGACVVRDFTVTASDGHGPRAAMPVGRAAAKVTARRPDASGADARAIADAPTAG